MVACCHCNAFVWKQEQISTSSELSPVFTICFGNGQVSIPIIAAETTLLELATGSSYKSQLFCKNICKYYATLSFTSMGANVNKDLASAKNGVYTYHVQGTVVHCISTLLPENKADVKFAQIYYLDPGAQTGC